MDEKRKILIIDDEPDLLKVIKNRLESWGFEVFSWTTGAGALKQVLEIRPDLIILDIMLPDINGYDLCYKIKKTPEISSIPVIVATAKQEWQEDMGDIGRFAKADDCIPKPFEPDILFEKINKLLSK
ncbi:MAG: response regulator [Candidatus Omnitrophica bacterium]|nr:response regulator [Candidatus Omnitrophota bacterium]